MAALNVPSLKPSPVTLLLIDFVNPLDFEGGDDLRAPALQAAQATAKLRRKLRRQGVQTVYANDNYGMWRADFNTLHKDMVRRRGESGDMARLLAPQRGDFTILKPRHSAFYATPLELLLEQLQCKRLILTGLAADSCVLFSAMDAYVRDYEVWVPEDCVASESEDAKQQALAQMRRVLKARTDMARA